MPRTTMSRRDFLKAAGLALGATAAACSGLALLGMRQPPLTFPNETIGGTMTKQRILVAYASRGGSTAGVAQAIGKQLADSGAQVDVRSMKDLAGVDQYEAVVLGSAIRGGAWLPEAMQFLRTHQPALDRKPLAAFLVCITLAMPGGDQYRQSVSGWMKDVRALIRPVSEACFAGAINYATVPLVPDGLQLRIMSVAMKTPPGDYRDWDAIRVWAAQLPQALADASTQLGSFSRTASQPSLVA